MCRGLGRFQQWILAAAYAKTVKHETPETWRQPAGCVAGQHQRHLDVWNENLSRAEILLNYFHLTASDRRKPQELWHQCFRQTRAYRTALASMNQTLWRLYLAGLIEWGPCLWSIHSLIQWDGIKLTPEGVSAAEKITVNLSDLISGRS